jgi:hypothetical protein
MLPFLILFSKIDLLALVKNLVSEVCFQLLCVCLCTCPTTFFLVILTNAVFIILLLDSLFGNAFSSVSSVEFQMAEYYCE